MSPPSESEESEESEDDEDEEEDEAEELPGDAADDVEARMRRALARARSSRLRGTRRFLRWDDPGR